MKRFLLLRAAGSALAVFAISGWAQSTNGGPKLLPPAPELAPTFWEASGWAVGFGVGFAVVLLAVVLWLVLRPRPPVVIPPEHTVRVELASLRPRAEDGKLLSEVSQLLRQYLMAGFDLPKGEFTSAEFKELLAQEPKVGAELARPVSDFLQRCDERKFSPMPTCPPFPAVQEAEQLVAQAEARRAALRTEAGSPK